MHTSLSKLALFLLYLHTMSNLNSLATHQTQTSNGNIIYIQTHLNMKKNQSEDLQ